MQWKIEYECNGTRVAPGKSNKYNSFGLLRSMLTYKLEEQGKKLIIKDKWYPSSKICHKCGNEYKELTR